MLPELGAVIEGFFENMTVRIMVDAASARRREEHSLSPAQLRDRARHHRDIAARLFDARLERVLIDEAEALERRAATLELQAAESQSTLGAKAGPSREDVEISALRVAAARLT